MWPHIPVTYFFRECPPHIGCALCIQKLVEGGKQNVECSECHLLSCNPDRGVNKMRTVLRVLSLAEKHKEMRDNALQNVFHAQRKESITTPKCSDHHGTVAYVCRKFNIT